MHHQKWLLLALTVLVAGRGLAAVADLRLYTLDCGHATFKDMSSFSDTGEYDGKPGDVAVPCFLIRHPKGDLLWDLGMGDHFAATPEGTNVAPGVQVIVPITLTAQLQALAIAPKDISFIAFSHLHWDHTGNANAFPESVWIMNSTELAAGLMLPPPPGVLPDTWSVFKTAKQEVIDGDYDVFGDGSVMILRAPGHTPGHQVLKLKLAKSGTVILSGDLWHQRSSLDFKRVPTFNVSRADTLASMGRIETILKNTHGRVIVQHDMKDYNALPKAPAFLD